MIKQLAKTTPYLTGNHKLDIILARDKDDFEFLTDSYINISSTTPSIPYPTEIKESIYNYSYAENIRQFYELTKDYFYKDMGGMKSNHAIYSNNKVDVFDHTYQSGFKRAEYGIYNKQWHFFCPIYINTTSDIDKLSFRISVRGEATDTNSHHITPPQENMVREIKLSDVLKGFLTEYLQDIDDNILNIYISKNYGNISGMDVTSGVNKVVDISYIFPDLLDREKTLIEFDNLLMRTFEQNKLAVRQILNLDFYFSPDDIFAKTIVDNLKWKRWNVVVDVLFDGQKVDFVDIYSNFNQIPKCIIRDGEYTFDNTKNVLDYLHDNKDASNITLNKDSQPLCHWSVLENPDYIYNLYNGFSPVIQYIDSLDQRVETEASGYFFNQCNPIIDGYSKNINNLTWCKFIHLATNNTTSINQLEHLIDNDDIFTEISLENTRNNELWLNNNKFITTGINYFSPIRIAVITVPENVTRINLVDQSQACEFYIGHKVGTNKVIFIMQNKPEFFEKLTLFSVVNRNWSMLFFNSPGILYDDIARTLLLMVEPLFRNYESPNRIIFDKSIIPMRKQSGVPESDEIFYVKNDMANIELYRYEGRLIPTFIPTDGNSNIYYNEDWTYKTFIGGEPETEELKRYAGMANKLKSQPLYPSVGYFPYNSSKSVYYTFPEYYDDYLGDIQWQKAGLIYYLPEVLEYTFIESKNTTVDDGYLMDYLCHHIPIDPYTLIYYIYNQYKYQVDFEYEAPDNVDYLRYHVKFMLK